MSLAPAASAVFCSGELKVESLERGYLACEAYVWLGQHGDAVSKYEMQTILLENEAEVRNRTTAMNNEFLRLIEEAKTRDADETRQMYDSQMSNEGEATTPEMNPKSPKQPRMD